MGSGAAVKLACVIAQLMGPPSFKNEALPQFGDVSEGSQTSGHRWSEPASLAGVIL